MNKLLILGEFTPDFPPHLLTNSAIEHSCHALGINLPYEWVSTESIDRGMLARCSGIWIAPGSPYKSMTGALDAIRFAREKGIPCLGTCGGFQHMVIEYARNVLGFSDAQHAEYDPYASRLFVSRLDCSLVGREMKLKFHEGSQVAGHYGSAEAIEQYYCNFGVAPDCVDILNSGGLNVVGSDALGEARVVELPSHRFFVGTLYVPQARSTPAAPHPLITKFIQEVNRVV